jgi:hypothetical protein
MQVLDLRRCAETDPGPQRYLTAAAVRLLICNGLRVAESTGANLTDLGHES